MEAVAYDHTRLSGVHYFIFNIKPANKDYDCCLVINNSLLVSFTLLSTHYNFHELHLTG